MNPTNHDSNAKGFEQLANEQPQGGSLVRDFIHFLADNKKWWLAPIVLALLVIGALLILSGSAVAPFIYTLF